MIAGGLGGTTGDLLMHSLDTVKTRQQGDPHIPPKYSSMSTSYATIMRQEGIRRGLYGGWVPALLGSFPGTVIFFGTYEYSKRHMIDFGIQPQLAYLSSGTYWKGIDSMSRRLTITQDFSQISRRLSSMYRRKYSKLGYSSRADITIPSSSRVTTTNLLLMP